MGVVYYANYFVWFEVGRTDLLREPRLELSGDGSRRVLAAGDRSALRLPAAGAVRRRARDARRRATLLSPVRVAVQRTRSCGPPTARSLATGHTVHAALDRDGRPCRLPDRVQDVLRMKALVTGAAGFIGSTLAERLARATAPTSSASTASPTTTRARSRSAISAALLKHPRFRFVESHDSGRGSCSAARRSHARLSSGGAGRRSEELGTRLRRSTPSTTSRRRRCCSRRARAPALERLVYASSSSVYGDNVAMPMREDALPQPVSPYGVTQARRRTALLSLLRELRRARPCRCATSPSTDRGSGPIWASTSSSARRFASEPISLYGDGEQTRDFTFVHDAVGATIAAATKGVPGRVSSRSPKSSCSSDPAYRVGAGAPRTGWGRWTWPSAM